MNRLLCVLCLSTLFFACNAESKSGNSKAVQSRASFTAPVSIPAKLVSLIDADNAAFQADLKAVLVADNDGLLVLVDKKHPLSSAFVPPNLVPLNKGRSYVPNRNGLSLRAPAEAALERMAVAARKDGITLVASSTYRSYEYQKGVYARNVNEMGQKEADRVSAKPGTSQHQFGSAVDFGSITDDFAKTSAGRWLSAHAAEYGWSLSFPEGYEAITGYRWECWHYRYVGPLATGFQKKWVGDVQQYMMEYIDAWKVWRDKNQ